MKRIIIALCTFYLCSMLFTSPLPYRIVCGTVTGVEHGEVVVTDCNGDVWAFYGGGYYDGQTVKMLIYNNTTPRNIYDDIIIYTL